MRALLQKTQKHLATIVQKTIFVVDDDPSMRLGVKRLLNQHGFETELFDSVEDFHERADVRRPHCLVLDIKLKNKSGIDLARELTNSGVSLPVIFITANDTDYCRKVAADAGCAAYLTKPFLGKTLIDAIEKVAASNRMP